MRHGFTLGYGVKCLHSSLRAYITLKLLREWQLPELRPLPHKPSLPGRSATAFPLADHMTALPVVSCSRTATIDVITDRLPQKSGLWTPVNDNSCQRLSCVVYGLGESCDRRGVPCAGSTKSISTASSLLFVSISFSL